MHSLSDYAVLFLVWLPPVCGVVLIVRGIARQCRPRNAYRIPRRRRLHLPH